MGLPLIKLAFLAVKQVAKPVASRIKAHAREAPFFRGTMIALGRKLHFGSVQLERIADGKAALRHVSDLTEQVAVERGTDFLAEAVVYSVSASIVGYEFVMSERKAQAQAAKEAAKEAEVLRLKEANEELQWQELRQMHLIQSDLRHRLMLLEEERSRRWWRWRPCAARPG